MKKGVSILFSMPVTGLLLAVFAVSIGIATFIEYGSGTDTAKILVYDSIWFKLLLILIVLNLLGSIIINKLISRKRWPVFLFHLSFIVILAGGGLTRLVGSTGIMHIRENVTEQHYLTDRSYVSIDISDGTEVRSIQKVARFSERTRNRFKETLAVNDKSVLVEIIQYMPAAKRIVVANGNGGPVISLVAFDRQNQQLEFILERGEEMNFNNIVFSFEKPTDETTVLIRQRDGALVLTALNNSLSAGSMGTELIQLPILEEFPLNKGMIYQIGHIGFVLTGFTPRGRTQLVDNSADKEAGSDGLKARIQVGDQSALLEVLGNKGLPGQAASVNIEGTVVSVAYGPVLKKLPFSMHLNDFRIERYPGSSSPSSLISEITVIDPAEPGEKPFRITSNNTLKYKGYRFFQTSNDQDEMGTILSVNYDTWGTKITYIGYALMMVGMLFSLIPKIFYRPLAAH